MPRVPVNRDAALAANTAYAGVVLGTPVTRALAANSLIISNTIASGDVSIMANRGGNSEEYFLADSSAGQLRLTSPADHLLINTVLLTKNVRINSITDSTTTSGSAIGFQSKPGLGTTGTASLTGGEISPRLNDGVGGNTVIGLHVDAFLKGTTGNLTGDVRGMQIELVTDDAGTRTISGGVVGLRFRAAFSGTITGDMVMIRGEKAETQTNSKQWEYFLELTGDNALIWRDDYTTEVTTIAGAIKVRVNGADRWIALYSGAPVV